MRIPLIAVLVAQVAGGAVSDFNGGWTVRREGGAETSVTLPHDAAIAGPFDPALGGTKGVRTSVSDRRLTDEHFYPKGSIWYQEAEGKMIRQSAPAVIARGLTLPHVESVAGDYPFVLACRHPNGSLAFATHYRRFGDCVKTPLVRIESEIAWTQGVPLGCFGQFESLTLRMGNQSCRVYASDLAGGERWEITQGVHFGDGRVTIPGEVLTPIRNRSVLDETNSMPGWLLECEKV